MQAVRCGPYIVDNKETFEPVKYIYTAMVLSLIHHSSDLILLHILRFMSICYWLVWWLHSKFRLWKWTIALTTWLTYDSFALILRYRASGNSYSNRSENEFAVNSSISLGLNIIIHIHNNVICNLFHKCRVLYDGILRVSSTDSTLEIAVANYLSISFKYISFLTASNTMCNASELPIIQIRSHYQFVAFELRMVNDFIGWNSSDAYFDLLINLIWFIYIM